MITALSYLDLPQLEGRFSGCGDLFTAMVAAGIFYQKILYEAPSFLALFEKSHHLLGRFIIIIVFIIIIIIIIVIVILFCYRYYYHHHHSSIEVISRV